MSTVGFPGPRGSHSDAAAAVLAPAAAGVDLPSFTAVVEAVSNAEVAVGVLPIESSLIGPIAETHDLLVRRAALDRSRGDAADPHCLVGLPGATLDDAAIVRSHPAAFDQCRDLLAGSDGAAHRRPRRPPTRRARSPRPATRGRLRSRAPRPRRPTGSRCWPTTSATARRVHPLRRARAVHAGRARRGLADGALVRHRPPARCALPRARPARADGVNLVQLVSRPLPNSPWRYRFDVVLDGHVFDPTIRPALARAARADPRAAAVRFLRCGAPTVRRRSSDKIWDAHLVADGGATGRRSSSSTSTSSTR